MIDPSNGNKTVSVDAELILRQAQEQHLQLDPARAAELAREVSGLSASAFAVSKASRFEDEPANFLACLSAFRAE